MTTVVDYRDAVLNALGEQWSLDVFDGRPKYRLDGDGRAHIAATLHMGIGSPDPLQETLAGGRPLVGLTFQVTAAGGDLDRCLLAARKVREALTDVELSGAGFCREDSGFLFPREDRDVTPPVWFLPVVYRVDIP